MTTGVTIHERILQQVESTEVHRSSNSILKEEIVALRQGVDELVATFAKVEEVRDAVKQLEQGKASNGRSVGLTEVMNSVLELQRQLEEALEKTTTGMTMRSEETEKQVRGKRTREVSSSSDSSSSSESSSSSSSSSDEEEEEVKPKRKKQTNSDVEAEKEPELEKLSSDDGMALKTGDPCLQLARACLKTILNVKTVDNRIQPDMKTSWTKALRNIQQILKQQGRSGAATADNAAARMTAHALDSVVSVLKKIDWNTELVKEVHPLLEAFANACCSNETLTSYFVRARTQLYQLLVEKSHWMRKNATGGNKELLKRLLWTYQDMTKSVNTITPHRIAETLSILEILMRMDSTCKYEKDVQGALVLARQWAAEIPLNGYLRNRFRCFVTSSAKYIKWANGSHVELRRIVKNIGSIIEGKGTS